MYVSACECMHVCKVTAMAGSIGSGVHMDRSDQASLLVKVSNHEANSVRREGSPGRVEPTERNHK